ncbi:hypothetical protein [Dietzia sp. SYD-A1]|uniref:hypothetical protein n=1 Tax=Dietzia sp. SYD-A1 TaxID=2780141 RepID=UPI0018912A90|nr:hypothetical protein [Dietzia sp. SYD-A1]
MLDIAYLALMLACLAGCVLLVDRLSRSDESATSPGLPATGLPAPDPASRDTASPGSGSRDTASTCAASADTSGARR